MEGIIFGVVIGLIIALVFFGCGIIMGQHIKDEPEYEIDTDADILSAKLRVMAATGVSIEESNILKNAADYIEKKGTRYEGN